MGSETKNRLVSDRVRSQLRLPNVGQIGYVVNDVHHTIKDCLVTQKRIPWLVLDHDHQRSLAGRQGRCTLRIALAYEGPLQLELIQVLKGETIHVNATGTSEIKIHHFGFMVRDLENRLKYCQGQGAKLLQKGTINSAGITVEYAYLDASNIGGTNIILELIQWRLGPFPMPANRYVFSLLLTLGSWNIFKGKIVR